MDGSDVIDDSLQGSIAVYERHRSGSVDGSDVIADSLQRSTAVYERH